VVAGWKFSGYSVGCFLALGRLWSMTFQSAHAAQVPAVEHNFHGSTYNKSGWFVLLVPKA
jgi:hypothetical protein